MLAFRFVGNFARQTEKGREGEKGELKITQIISEASFGLESEDPIKQQYKDILITSGDHRYPPYPILLILGGMLHWRHSSCLHRYIRLFSSCLL